MSKGVMFAGLVAMAFAASPVTAQLLGGLPGPVSNPVGQIGNTVGQLGNDLGRLGNSGINQPLGLPGGRSQSTSAAALISLDRVGLPIEPIYSTAAQLAELRALRHRILIAANRATLDRDDDGHPVRKNELVAADPDERSLALAARAGFNVIADERSNDLGIRLVTLAVPKGMNVRQALKALRRAAPAIDADFNHVYEPAGGALIPAASATLAATLAPFRPGTRIAMIDGGVASHPSMAGASIDQRGFSGPPQPTGHGTAVGSLLVGDQGPFRGAARGAQLFVGDVYGGSPAAGSATSIVKALSWAASKRPSVINISLIGPNNRGLQRAIAALQARGIGVVAAVGNDGPAAPPQYPASYPGVIAVTGVDKDHRALREAGRATHLDFAAPGADLVAALPGKGFTPVRGTSFAAPFVAARLAATGSPARLAAEAVPGKGKVGRGVVCATCDVPPKAIGLKHK
jgi:hypothetical protein